MASKNATASAAPAPDAAKPAEAKPTEAPKNTTEPVKTVHPADSLTPFPAAHTADYKNWHDKLMFDPPVPLVKHEETKESLMQIKSTEDPTPAPAAAQPAAEAPKNATEPVKV